MSVARHRACRRPWLAPAIALAMSLAAVLAGDASAKGSVCYGSPADGRLDDGVSLPLWGANYRSYSAAGWVLGRTFVHDQVSATLLDAWRALETAAPGATYVYGETGWPRGGRIRPHRTHRNGLSVDLMVPVLRGGTSVPLPTGPTNRYGYDIEFDEQGRYRDYRIDFEALGEHLYQLQVAAQARGFRIRRVIFEVPLQTLLWNTRRGAWLRRNLSFSTRPAWVRHDEHYHVDFELPCRPMS
jgi:penicillin-insensitive murein DD-endopeptidase